MQNVIANAIPRSRREVGVQRGEGDATTWGFDSLEWGSGEDSMISLTLTLISKGMIGKSEPASVLSGQTRYSVGKTIPGYGTSVPAG